MRKIIKALIESCFIFIGRLLAILYPFSIAKKLRYYKTVLYTHWVSSDFKSFGKYTYLTIQLISLEENISQLGKKLELEEGAILLHGTYTEVIHIVLK